MPVRAPAVHGWHSFFLDVIRKVKNLQGTTGLFVCLFVDNHWSADLRHPMAKKVNEIPSLHSIMIHFPTILFPCQTPSNFSLQRGMAYKKTFGDTNETFAAQKAPSVMQKRSF